VDSGRLEAFSDGVFAVAITLLALDLKLDGPRSARSLGWQLGDHWASFAAFITSFLVIGIIWVNHHAVFVRVRRVDRSLLFFNLALLLCVTLIPFATSTFAAYLPVGGWDAKAAAALYGAVTWGLALSFSGIYWWVGRDAGLLHESVDVQGHRGAIRQFGVGSVLYPLTIGLAFVSAEAALAAQFALAVFYAFDRTAMKPVSDSPPVDAGAAATDAPGAAEPE